MLENIIEKIKRRNQKKTYKLIVIRYDVPMNDVILRKFNEYETEYDPSYKIITEEKEIETDDIIEYLEAVIQTRRDIIEIKYEEVGE